jgi:voltage-gated sodium channel
VIEIALKLVALGGRFFRSGWNLFDFVIVGIALVPAAQGLSVLRALRILRVLRILSVVPSLRRVVEGLMTALPGMGSVFLLMSIIFYIGAVMATKLFSESFPDWFGTLGDSLYTLFQIMTLESWSMGIVRPVLEVYPYAWAFFVPFIMVTTFAVVNLIVGLVVNSMQDAHAEESNAATDAYRDEVLERLKAIEERLGPAFSIVATPSVVSTFSTISSAFIFATAYMSRGLAWSMNTSGRTIERYFSPVSNTPRSARSCAT